MRYIVQRARIQSGTAFRNVELPADTVVFIFDEERTCKRGEDLVLSIGWSSEHEFHRTKQTYDNVIELPTFGEGGGLTNVAQHHVGTADRPNRTSERPANAILRGVFFYAYP